MQITCKQMNDFYYYNLNFRRMNKYRFKGVSVINTLDKRRIRNDGTYPIKVQVVFKGKQKYYKTDKCVDLKNWEKLPSSKCRELVDLRNYINDFLYTVCTGVYKICNNKDFSFEELDTLLGRKTTYTINCAMQEKIDSLFRNNQINSYYSYRSALHALERYAGKEIKFASINVKWLRACEAFWLNEGLSYSSMSFYFRNLKCVINKAIQDNILPESAYPFGVGKYEIPRGNSRKLALTKKDIKRIVDYKCPDSTVRRNRDLWFFSYLCNGINFKDMIFLRYSDIKNGEVCFLRDKTARSTGHSKLIHATITPEMSAIIKEWGNKDKAGFIFPFASGGETELQKVRLTKKVVESCNKSLRTICKDLDLEKVTTYSARHSFATILKNSGVNVSFISESLGHSSIMVTQAYLDMFDNEERKRNSTFLTDF